MRNKNKKRNEPGSRWMCGWQQRRISCLSAKKKEKKNLRNTSYKTKQRIDDYWLPSFLVTWRVSGLFGANVVKPLIDTLSSIIDMSAILQKNIYQRTCRSQKYDRNRLDWQTSMAKDPNNNNRIGFVVVDKQNKIISSNTCFFKLVSWMRANERTMIARPLYNTIKHQSNINF